MMKGLMVRTVEEVGIEIKGKEGREGKGKTNGGMEPERGKSRARNK